MPFQLGIQERPINKVPVTPDQIGILPQKRRSAQQLAGAMIAPGRRSPGEFASVARPPRPGLRQAGFAKRPDEIVDRGDYRPAGSLFCSQYWYLPQAFAAPRSGRLDRYRSFCPSSVKSMRLPRCRGESIADDVILS